MENLWDILSNNLLLSSQSYTSALVTGLIYGLVALGVYISFRILEFPDLTVDGSFPLGGAVAAVMIVGGFNPWIATAIAVLSGVGAGLVTAAMTRLSGIMGLLSGFTLAVILSLFGMNGWLAALIGFIAGLVIIRLVAKYRPAPGIMGLLASILTMTALVPSVITHVMNMRPNIPIPRSADTIYSGFRLADIPILNHQWGVALLIVMIVIVLLWRFFESDIGLAMRATGANPKMARAQGIEPTLYIYIGMGLSNGLVALGGALFAQAYGYADVTAGVGTIVMGLAAVIIGQTILPMRNLFVILVSCIIGALIYRLVVAYAISNKIPNISASDINLVTALIVLVALALPLMRGKGGK